MGRCLEPRQLFPELKTVGEPEFWCGLRPATPSNLPYIGGTRYANLWLNTGHGTLGWTLACGSAQLLADLAAGRDPGLDAAVAALAGSDTEPAMTLQAAPAL